MLLYAVSLKGVPILFNTVERTSAGPGLDAVVEGEDVALLGGALWVNLNEIQQML